MQSNKIQSSCFALKCVLYDMQYCCAIPWQISNAFEQIISSWCLQMLHILLHILHILGHRSNIGMYCTILYTILELERLGLQMRAALAAWPRQRRQCQLRYRGRGGRPAASNLPCRCARCLSRCPRWLSPATLRLRPGWPNPSPVLTNLWYYLNRAAAAQPGTEAGSNSESVTWFRPGPDFSSRSGGPGTSGILRYKLETYKPLGGPACCGKRADAPLPTAEEGPGYTPPKCGDERGRDLTPSGDFILEHTRTKNLLPRLSAIYLV